MRFALMGLLALGVVGGYGSAIARARGVSSAALNVACPLDCSLHR